MMRRRNERFKRKYMMMMRVKVNWSASKMYKNYFNSRNPLRTSPSASTSVFPCSLVMFFARSDMLARIMCWSLSITCWRVRIDVWLQVLKARFEDSTAAFISSCVHFGTRVTTSLVAGSWSSIQSFVFESTNLPSMNIFTVGATFDVLYERLITLRTCAWKLRHNKVRFKGLINNFSYLLEHLLEEEKLFFRINELPERQ